MPRPLRTAVVVGGAAHVGAKRAQKAQAAPPPAAPAAAAPTPPAAPDDATEIKKYAALRDSGVITEEEFTAKKKAILGI